MAEIQVCVECGTKVVGLGEPPLGERLYDLVAGILETEGHEALSLRKVACLGNCDAECRLVLADPDRWSWMLGDMDIETDEALLREVFRLWLEAPNGLIPKALRPQGLKDKALGRMPPVLSRNRKT